MLLFSKKKLKIKKNKLIKKKKNNINFIRKI